MTFLVDIFVHIPVARDLFAQIIATFPAYNSFAYRFVDPYCSKRGIHGVLPFSGFGAQTTLGVDCANVKAISQAAWLQSTNPCNTREAMSDDIESMGLPSSRGSG